MGRAWWLGLATVFALVGCIEPEHLQVVDDESTGARTGEGQEPSGSGTGGSVESGTGGSVESGTGGSVGTGTHFGIWNGIGGNVELGTGGGGGQPPIGGASPIETLAQNLAHPTELAVDATHAYWTNEGTHDELGNYNYDGSVVRIPVGGGTVVPLATDRDRPEGLVIDDTHVYWAGAGGVFRVPKAGGAVVTIAEGNSSGPVVTDTHVYWTQFDGNTADIKRTTLDGQQQETFVGDIGARSTQLVLGGSWLYWGLEEGGVWGVPLDLSSGPTYLSRGDVTGMAADSTSVYWMDNPCEITPLRKLSVGDELITLAREPGCNPSDIVVDGGNLYWLMENGPDDDWDSGRVVRSPTEPGVSDTLAVGEDRPVSIAVDTNHVYWLSTGTTDDYTISIGTAASNGEVVSLPQRPAAVSASTGTTIQRVATSPLLPAASTSIGGSQYPASTTTPTVRRTSATSSRTETVTASKKWPCPSSMGRATGDPETRSYLWFRCNQ